MREKQISRGDIYYATLNPVTGSEQGGYRPILVVQNNVGNAHSPTIVVVPVTRNLNKNPLPTHVIIPQSCGFDADCLALVEQIRTIDRSRINKYVGSICPMCRHKLISPCLFVSALKKSAHPKAK